MMIRKLTLTLAVVVLTTTGSTRAFADQKQSNDPKTVENNGARLAGQHVYTITNDPRQNGIAGFERQSDGSLIPLAGSPFATGGKGLVGGDIDEQGAIRIHENHVIAVNPGSDSVAVLAIGDDGGLTPVEGAPFPSGGTGPLSLTIYKDLLYVANQAPAFAQPSDAPNIMGFRTNTDGKLTPIAKSKITFPGRNALTGKTSCDTLSPLPITYLAKDNSLASGHDLGRHGPNG
jgi:hypothetical protein